MIDTPQIVQSTARQVAMIRLTVAASQIQTVMGPGIREVYETLAAQGIGPAGPWFTHHVRRPTDVFYFENLRAHHDAGNPCRARAAGGAARRDGRAHGLPRAVRGPRRPHGANS